jgi:hypothetical protein
LNSFFVFFQWFELCFQASFLVAKRIHFWSSFSLSGLFLEPFLAHVWFIFRLFWLIFRSWAHFGSAGGQLFHHKNGLDHQRRPSGISPKINSLFWSNFGVSFCDFFCFLSSIFKHRFLWSSEADFSWILASFRHHFFIFFVLVRTSDFSDF